MSWWTRLLQRGRLEGELDNELRDHVERQVSEHVRAGMSEREARRQARLDFGGLDQVKEMCRDARGTRWLEETWQDLRFAVRPLVKERWVAAAAVLALGLGIGLTSTGFTVYDAMLRRGLPVDDPHRIVALTMRDANGRDQGISRLDLEAWRAAATSFGGLAAYSEPAMNVGDPGMATERVYGARVTANAFRLLGIEPALGRDFRPEDDRPGAPAVVMLGYDIWTSRYAADPEVVDRVVSVNATPATVIGVMPEGFAFPRWAELWQPLWLTPDLAQHARDRRTFRAVGRLGDGVSLLQARAELNAITGGLAAAYPDTNAGFRSWVGAFHDQYADSAVTRSALTALMAAAFIVLLIACANAASLVLARAARRSREVDMRVSLGATRARIVRQLVAECLVVAGLAGVLGLGLALLGARLLSASIEPLVAPYWYDFAIDRRELAFVLATCLSTVLIFGLAPALHTSKGSRRNVGTAGALTGTASHPAHRWMQWLLTAELALTLVLLAAAGLMTRSLLVLARADSVLDTTGVTTIALSVPEARYATADQRATLLRTLTERVAASPSIASATHASAVPFAPIGTLRRELTIDGRPPFDGEPPPTARVITIADAYFEALDLRLEWGRQFNERDGIAGNDSVIVNRRFVDLFFANEDPLGRRIRLTPRDAPDDDPRWLTIVGVSPTVRQNMAVAAGPIAYVPYRGESTPLLHLVVRGERGTAAAADVVRGIVSRLDPDLPLARVWTLDGLLAQTLFFPRLIGSFLAAFAWIALVLSAVGLYGVTAYAVTQRTQEIGVRMALGAHARQVGWMIFRRGLVPLGIGFAIGIWGALTVGWLLETWLVETRPTDPVTQLAVAALLAAVSVVACLRPARRAARLDPLVALRHE